MSFNDPQTIQLALLGAAVLAICLQAIFLIAVLVVARGAVKSLREELEHYRSSIMPVIFKTREVVHNIAPRIEDAAADLAVITKSLRAQTADVQAAAEDIIERTRGQVSRVDGILTTILDRVEKVGVYISDVVAKPMRQLSGLLASVKAAVETLREVEPGQPPAPAQPASFFEDEDSYNSPRPAPKYRR
jgi:hypothetical protein